MIALDCLFVDRVVLDVDTLELFRMIFVDDLLGGVVGPTVTRDVNCVVTDVFMEDGLKDDLIGEMDEETLEVVFIEYSGMVVFEVVNSVDEISGKIIDVGFVVDLTVDKELETPEEKFSEELLIEVILSVKFFIVVFIEDLLVVICMENGFVVDLIVEKDEDIPKEYK